MILENDWRLTGQESYLKGKVLYHRNWRTRISRCDHDHCEFCWKKFSDADGDAHKGYTTADDYYWICPACFKDFERIFAWTVMEEDGANKGER